jgi:hypothetical protein
VTDEKQNDCFYVATYSDGASNQRGGKFYKFAVTDTADKIKVSQKHVWKGFPEIVNISYKNF